MKTFVNEHNPKDFLHVDEFIELRKAVLQEFRAAHGLDSEAPVPQDAADEPPGDDAPPGDVEKEDEPVQVRVPFHDLDLNDQIWLSSFGLWPCGIWNLF